MALRPAPDTRRCPVNADEAHSRHTKEPSASAVLVTFASKAQPPAGAPTLSVGQADDGLFPRIQHPDKRDGYILAFVGEFDRKI